MIKTHHKHNYKIEGFWGVITALSTMLLVVVAWFQLGDLNKIESEKFLEEIKKDFFTEQSRQTFILFESNQLKFKIITDSLKPANAIAIFQKEKSAAFDPYFDSIGIKRKLYFSNEIDDYLFTHFEDIGKLYKRKLILLDDIDQDFGYYITVCYENEEVQKYIKWVRSNSGDSTLYNKFEFIYDKLKKAK